MGALAAGGAATMGTGAVTSFTGDRDAKITLTNDANGMIGIQQATESPNSEYFDTQNGLAVLNIGDEVIADGFNEGQTYIDALFELRNQSGTDQYVWIVEDGVKGGDKAVGFYAGTGPSDGSPPDYQLSVGSNDLKPRDLQPLKHVPTHAAKLEPGESVRVGLVVDTRPLGSGNPSPVGELLEKITVQSVQSAADLPSNDPRDLDPNA
ncbi:MAG: hypothetical protein ABEJ61_00365 [Haloferacaceae archaeon]